jgi:ATP-dependent Lon protease
LAELKKLRMMSPMSAESTVVRNYLEWMVALPWYKSSKVNTDINAAQKVLDKDHYGLEKVKDRILEFLAVQSRINKIKGPILCLVGAPGVGKTSLGKSIAKATGREFVRMSLGGVRDEAEIRGHRRTYIGSLPGKIIQMMKKTGTKNPLFLLDEIDKVGNDYRGDPSSALLEALDPEQNNTFNDHYLEVDYDLSNVMFVTTANTLNIPGPLLDRMEVIRISGYTEDEKTEIAKKYLIPKQIKDSGLNEGEWKIDDESIKTIIRNYTRESGVRGLEREISKLTRKAVKEIVTKKNTTIDIKDEKVEEYLGVKKFKYGEIEQDDKVGVVTGLAWTEVGGEILSIETLVMPGKGKLELTGKLGDVMKESMQAAKSFVRSRCLEFGIIPPTFEKKDIHIHVPEGATPKDGPSAGIGMVTAIVSALTGVPVKKDVAMTGEVTLSGRVLPIGGLKEKLLAALRGGIKTAIIPEENEKDLKEIPDNVKKGLTIIPVKHVEQVLKIALTKELKPIEWAEIEQIPSNNNKGTSQESKH